jgi:hypothetical protein
MCSQSGELGAISKSEEECGRSAESLKCHPGLPATATSCEWQERLVGGFRRQRHCHAAAVAAVAAAGLAAAVAALAFKRGAAAAAYDGRLPG